MMQLDGFLERLRRDYPELKFRLGKKFMFRPPRTIYYESPPRTALKPEQNSHASISAPALDQNTVFDTLNSEQNSYYLQLLHEVGHAVLGHRDFGGDLERVRMERAAWEQARQLCAKYDVYYDADFVESELDTYRDWLHQRSVCKSCGQTRYQAEDRTYHCPFCENFKLKAQR